MAKNRILYVCQEIVPYLPASDMATLCRTLAQAMQERGNEIRTFMPRYGCINEYRNQLHEVIRLSGMNLIINDNDHQLIIKVASIPSARVQIYFIDNDDCFSRKAVMTDEEGKPFEDNDERAIFFARGVLETVKKLRWEPTIVHCHGWFSSIVPIYLREVFSDDPIFKDVKIVASIYGEGYEGELSSEMSKKIVNEGVDIKKLKNIEQPSYQNLMKLVIDYADGIVVETPTLDAEIADYLAASGKKVLEYQDKTTTEYLDNYQKFYDELL